MYPNYLMVTYLYVFSWFLEYLPSESWGTLNLQYKISYGDAFVDHSVTEDHI